MYFLQTVIKTTIENNHYFERQYSYFDKLNVLGVICSLDVTVLIHNLFR